MSKTLTRTLEQYTQARNKIRKTQRMVIISSQSPSKVRRKLDTISQSTAREMIVFLTRDFGLTIKELAVMIGTRTKILDRIIKGAEVKITRKSVYMLVLMFTSNRVGVNS